MRRVWSLLICLLTLATPLRAEGRLNVVASFSILGDFVRNVGGDRVNVTTLVGPNADVHVYTPPPQDAKRIADAKLVVVNGLGLEGWLPRLVESAGGKATIVVASNGMAPLKRGSDADPHAWQSVADAKVYVANIRDALSGADPACCEHGCRRNRVDDVRPQDQRRHIAGVAPGRDGAGGSPVVRVSNMAGDFSWRVSR